MTRGAVEAVVMTIVFSPFVWIAARVAIDIRADRRKRRAEMAEWQRLFARGLTSRRSDEYGEGSHEDTKSTKGGER